MFEKCLKENTYCVEKKDMSPDNCIILHFFFQLIVRIMGYILLKRESFQKQFYRYLNQIVNNVIYLKKQIIS